jgi:hypothetical protein
METWIIRLCRETSRRQVIAWAFALTAGVLFLIANARYVVNFIRGPYALRATELAQISDPETTPHYFISVHADKVLDTGIQEITTTTENGVKQGSYVSAGYYAVLVGDRYLIVKSATKPPSQIEGQLSTFPTDLSSELFSGTDGREIRNACYPFYLESEGFRYPGYWGIGIGVVFLLLFFKYGRPAWLCLRDINSHPVVSRVNHWSDPMSISVEAERELNSAVRYRSQGVFVTDRYLIVKRFFAFNILRFEDLLWAYKKVTKRSVNFIPTGKDYAAVLVFYGGSQNFPAGQKIVDEVLTFASTKAPWAILGYSKEIAELFRKQTSAFCQAVEARRQELLKNITS